MREYIPFAAMEQLLLTAIGLPGSSIKSIATATGIKANTLYKWKTTSVHLSPEKADRLLHYFMEYEPDRLELAELVLSQKSRDSLHINLDVVGIPFYINQYLYYYHPRLPSFYRKY